MPYGNPIVAGTTLVRQAIQSVNYAAGVAGWSINRDGSAEFNNVTARGQLIVGGAAGNVTINNSLPTELANFYSALASVSDATIRLSPDGTAYWYELVGILVGGNLLYAEGYVNDNLQVKEFFRTQIDPTNGAVQGIATYPTEVNFTSAGFVQADGPMLWTNSGNNVQSGARINFLSGSRLSVALGGDWFVDGNQQARGIVYDEVVTLPTNTGAVAGTEYAVWTSSGLVPFTNGRAYEVKIYGGKLKSASVQQPGVTLRRNNVAGAVLLNLARWPIVNTGQDLNFDPALIFVNTSGSTFADNLCLTLTPSVATLITFDAGAAPNQVQIVVRDVGAAAGFGVLYTGNSV